MPNYNETAASIFFKTFLSDLSYLINSNDIEAVRRASLISFQSINLNALQATATRGKKSSRLKSRRVHTGVVCDSCKSNEFEGDRYSCTVCTKYDLCSKCFCAGMYNMDHFPTHPCLCLPCPVKQEDFLKFEIESRLEHLAETYKSNENKNVECQICKIVNFHGIHIKCDSCYNCSLCFECWKKGEHDKFHPMLIFFTEILIEIPFNRISIIEKLGNGAFGDVYKASIKSEDNLVAVKMSTMIDDESRMSLKESIQSITNELNAHREIRSAYLCKLFGYSVTNGRICLILGKTSFTYF
jgi:hypothetical protein